MLRVVKCRCGEEASRTTGEEIYPHRPDLYRKEFYLCRGCGAYVGCHSNGQPMGTPADEKTRKARMRAHKLFDSVWRNGLIRRTKAYSMLSSEMGLTKEQTHIGMFTAEQCSDVLDIVKRWGKEGLLRGVR